MKFSELNFIQYPLGIQAKHFFPNGYGVSVIKNMYSYGGDKGLYELAVLDRNGNLTYDTPVTNDVEGYCSEQRIEELLNEVENLEMSLF